MNDRLLLFCGESTDTRLPALLVVIRESGLTIIELELELAPDRIIVLLG